MKKMFLNLEESVWVNRTSRKKRDEWAPYLKPQKGRSQEHSRNLTEEQQIVAQTPFSMAQATGTQWGNSSLTKYLAIKGEVHMVRLTSF